jgi:alpha-glucosidase
VIDEFPERVLIGEIYLPIERVVTYYGRDLCGAHLPFNFSLLETPWQADAVARLIERYEAALPSGAWPNWVFGNHDRPRLASRVGEAQARVAAMLLLTLRGTPTLYYGDEIGMRQVPISPDQVRDPWEKNLPGLGLGRDGCRTPMQWDASPYAGFSSAPPWLPLGEDAASCNVASERSDRGSLYNLYRRLIALRRAHPALATGRYRPLPADGNVLAFIREQGGERFFVALNFGPGPASAVLPPGAQGIIAISARADRGGEKLRGRLDLAGDDGVLVKLG